MSPSGVREVGLMELIGDVIKNGWRSVGGGGEESAVDSNSLKVFGMEQ